MGLLAVPIPGLIGLPWDSHLGIDISGIFTRFTSFVMGPTGRLGSGADDGWILESPGLSGRDLIHVGMRMLFSTQGFTTGTTFVLSGGEQQFLGFAGRGSLTIDIPLFYAAAHISYRSPAFRTLDGELAAFELDYGSAIEVQPLPWIILGLTYRYSLTTLSLIPKPYRPVSESVSAHTGLYLGPISMKAEGSLDIEGDEYGFVSCVPVIHGSFGFDTNHLLGTVEILWRETYEAVNPLGYVGEITLRSTGFSIRLRVKGELDDESRLDFLTELQGDVERGRWYIRLIGTDALELFRGNFEEYAKNLTVEVGIHSTTSWTP